MAARSSCSAIIASLRELEQPVRVHGLQASARAYLLIRWVVAQPGPVLAVCPTEEIASALHGDLELLRETYGWPARMVLLPTWPQSPYGPVLPSIRIRHERAAALAAMASATGEEPLIVVSTPAAVAQATAPPEIFTALSFEVRREESVGSREDLARRLLDAGYHRVDPADDPGSFAVRGDIVDVFPVGAERPVRIELFGDFVEKIRHYDPSTQRTGAEPEDLLESVAIPPAREAVIPRSRTAEVRHRLKLFADGLGTPRSVRDPVLESVDHGGYPDHSDTWAPLVFGEPATALDYLGARARVAWMDAMECERLADEFIEEQKVLEKEAREALAFVPPVLELFRWNDAIQSKLRGLTRLHVDSVEFADLSAEPLETGNDETASDSISDRHRVQLRENTDLVAARDDRARSLEEKTRFWLAQGNSVVFMAGSDTQKERLRYILGERGISAADPPPARGQVALVTGRLTQGFRWASEKIVFVNDTELFGIRSERGASESRKEKKPSAGGEWAGLRSLSDLSVGDLVVHVDHGIGKYLGLVRLSSSGAPSDFIQLEYAGNDKLYVPVYRLNVVQRYLGGDSAVVPLDKLGGQHFEKAKEKVRQSVKKLAFDLVQLYAKRELQRGEALAERGEEYREFEARFPFKETPDQLKAIRAVGDDLESGRIMDRLICGDVGFGKTEVAIRAAFHAVMSGKQVAVLVPTTLLSFQHEESFKARLAGYPFTIESLSRFKPRKEQVDILKRLEEGKVDIIIGTHRLLTQGVDFNRLGLVIIDEEHRFGVEHKERLKTLRLNTHVLTMTATPIPRTLQMALSGMRDISLITTPPVDRLPIRTYVSKFDENLIRRAIEFELDRGGQVFFLHNRVQSIHEIAARIQEIVPRAKIAVAHGQMSETELERTMLSFYRRHADVLVCTTIIESGIDVPSANTILINRADTLGLAQLYQLRGRVGRSDRRAYAYLLVSATGQMTDDAKRRLEVIQRFVELGSGFQIASYDMEIRGGGNILGPQQSGHIASVGFELYTELLEEAIREIRGQKGTVEESHQEPEIKAPFPAYLSEQYIPDVHQRLSLYRRLSAARSEDEVSSLEDELRDRYGKLPEEAYNLLWVIRIKVLLKRAGLLALTVGPERISLLAGPSSAVDPGAALAMAARMQGRFQVTPDSKIVYAFRTASLKDLYFELESLLAKLLTPAARRA